MLFHHTHEVANRKKHMDKPSVAIGWGLSGIVASCLFANTSTKAYCWQEAHTLETIKWDVASDTVMRRCVIRAVRIHRHRDHGHLLQVGLFCLSGTIKMDLATIQGHNDNKRCLISGIVPGLLLELLSAVQHSSIGRHHFSKRQKGKNASASNPYSKCIFF